MLPSIPPSTEGDRRARSPLPGMAPVDATKNTDDDKTLIARLSVLDDAGRGIDEGRGGRRRPASGGEEGRRRSRSADQATAGARSGRWASSPAPTASRPPSSRTSGDDDDLTVSATPGIISITDEDEDDDEPTASQRAPGARKAPTPATGGPLLDTPSPADRRRTAPAGAARPATRPDAAPPDARGGGPPARFPCRSRRPHRRRSAPSRRRCRFPRRSGVPATGPSSRPRRSSTRFSCRSVTRSRRVPRRGVRRRIRRGRVVVRRTGACAAHAVQAASATAPPQAKPPEHAGGRASRAFSHPGGTHPAAAAAGQPAPTAKAEPEARNPRLPSPSPSAAAEPPPGRSARCRSPLRHVAPVHPKLVVHKTAPAAVARPKRHASPKPATPVRGEPSR